MATNEVTLNPINEVEQTLDSGTTTTNYTGKFSVISDNVQMQDGNTKFTLNNFYDNWKHFKQNNAFFYHGSGIPGNEKLQIKLWYNPNY